MKSWRGLAVICSAVGMSIIGAAPAMAGRGIAIDQPPLYSPTVCTLGQDCAGYAVSTAPFDTAYIYSGGIVSFNQQLPDTASLSGGVASLGDGPYFAPGLSGTDYQVRLQYSYTGDGDALLINFYQPGIPIYAQGQDPNNFAGTPPDLQLQLYPKDYYASTSIGFGYGDGAAPQPGALIAYSLGGLSNSVSYDNGLLVGSKLADSDFLVTLEGTDPNTGSVQDQWVLRYGAVVDSAPEPSTWSMLLLGLGLAGAALRTRRRGAAAA